MKFFLLAFTFIVLSVNISAAQKEDILKGVILSRVSQFVTYRDHKDEFVICVYHDDSMYDALKELYKDKKYNSLPISIVEIDKDEKIPHCDIFYASKPSAKLKKRLQQHSPLSTLLVSDSVKDLEDGFMLSLYIKNKKVNIAINQQAIVDANLKVNYRLLKVASTVINPVKAE